MLGAAVMFAGVAHADYQKVTSTNDITSGDYLIVYEAGNVAFNGALETLDAANNTVTVEITDGTIASSSTIDAAIFTIDTESGTVKNASGKYIGVSSNSNGLKTSDDASTYTHTFAIDNDGNADIAAVFDGSTMTLRFNKASNQNRFRYYKNSGQEAIQLYKKVNGGETQETTAAAPTFSPNGGEFEESVTVTLNHSNPDAVIFYGFNENKNTWQEYTAPFELTETTTVYAYAFDEDCDNTWSQVVTATFTKKEPVVIPEGKIVFGDLDLVNSVQYSDPFDGGDFTVTFAGGSNDGKYYTTGSGIRVYGGGTMTVEAKSGALTKIVLEFDGDYKPTSADVVDGGTYDPETGVWTGQAAKVVFTRPSGNGHWRVKSVAAEVSNDIVFVAAPEINGETNFVGATTVTITAEEGAAIYYTLDGTEPTTEATLYETAIIIDATTTVKAIAVKDNVVSEVKSATFNKIEEISIAEALEIIDALENGATTEETYLVSGYVYDITEVSTDFGNATFIMSDDAQGTNQMTAYRVKGLNNEDITDENIIKKDWGIKVIGQLQKYVRNDVVTPEIKNGYIYSIDSVATAIETVQTAAVNNAAYNLAGQRVSEGYKGLVIKNGKKMLVK